jgi:hypothetical protein
MSRVPDLEGAALVVAMLLHHQMVLMLIRVVNRSAVSFAFLAACRNILVFLTQHNAKLRLNHFIRPLQNAEGNCQTNLFGRLQANDEFKLCCLVNLRPTATGIRREGKPDFLA